MTPLLRIIISSVVASVVETVLNKPAAEKTPPTPGAKQTPKTLVPEPEKDAIIETGSEATGDEPCSTTEKQEK